MTQPASTPTYRGVALGAGWCFDTNTRLTAGSAGVLRRAGYQGQEVLALFRYVSLGAPSPADITPAERDAVLADGGLLGLVQHVEYPHWSADPATGIAHGKAAVEHAQLVGYPAGCHIGLDMEGLGNAGAPVMGYVVAWADAVHAAGYRVLFYMGYDDGLPDALVTLLAQGGHVDAWWSDFGARKLPAPLAFAMKQHAQVVVAGIEVDPDEVLLPGVISVMGIDDDDPLPANPVQTDTKATPSIPIPDTAHGDTIPPPATDPSGG